MTSDTIRASDLFDCKMCGDCCKGYGGTFVSPDDIKAIADFIGEDTEGFVQRYCQMSGGKPVLLQGENGYCVFWDGKCSIHSVKPKMCKDWPFIKGVAIDVANWHIMSQFCPGIRTDMPDNMVVEYVKRVLAEKLE